MAASLAGGRDHLRARAALWGEGTMDLVYGLQALGRSEPTPAGASATLEDEGSPRVAFVFSGQCGQWPRMCAGLLKHVPAFREAFAPVARAIEAEAGIDPAEEVRRRPQDSRLDEMQIVQPVLFAVQVALARLLERMGVRPSVFVGHSMGEVAAAHVAGILSLEDAARVICQRSRLMATVAGPPIDSGSWARAGSW